MPSQHRCLPAPSSGRYTHCSVSRRAAGPSPVPPTFADLYRFPKRRKESRVNRPFPRSTSGTESSNLSRSAKHIWTPPVSRVELLTRFGTQLQSYIRPGYRASDEALALMDFRALRSADQSGGLSRPCVATEFGSAGPTGSPSASHKTPYATSARAVFSAPISLWPHAGLRPALS